MNGSTIKAIRIKNRLSQRQLAAQLGITPSYLCQIERNKKSISDTIRIKLAQLFEVNDELIEAIRRSKLAL
ncbi:helix-turn-helix domain-containing protein [Paenibacillus solisilvae]|uniref:Helix-turn-helix domain-containing protein n=1 Tax=Paenibacillus solisilvae TaxID=2486751 RepID=A0ABW0VZ24_9BACL